MKMNLFLWLYYWYCRLQNIAAFIIVGPASGSIPVQYFSWKKAHTFARTHGGGSIIFAPLHQGIVVAHCPADPPWHPNCRCIILDEDSLPNPECPEHGTLRV